MKLNGVFEGGGVKGIGLVGALSRFEARGIHFDGVGGTSAGSIVAALYAAGYTAAEITEILLATDFNKLLDPSWPKSWDLVKHKGIHKGEKLYQWIYSLLEAKGVCYFHDLKPPKLPLKIVASDLTHKEVLVFDCQSYPNLHVAEAVRMSVGIPFFFEAYKFGNRLVVDGGVLSNYPLWLFSTDSGEDESNTTIGFKLVSQSQRNVPLAPKSFSQYLIALVGTMLEAHDKRNESVTGSKNTIHIDTGTTPTTKFALTFEEKEELYDAGCVAANEFLDKRPNLALHRDSDDKYIPPQLRKLRQTTPPFQHRQPHDTNGRVGRFFYKWVGRIMLVIALLAFGHWGPPMWTWHWPRTTVETTPNVSVSVSVTLIKANNAITGLQVGGQVVLPPKTHLWILTSHRIARGEWNVQGQATIDSRTGNVKMDIRAPAGQGLGCELRILPVIADDNAQPQLASYIEGEERANIVSITALPNGVTFQRIIDILPPGGCNKPHREPLQLDFMPSEDSKYRSQEAELAKRASEVIASDPTNITAYYDRALARTELGEQRAAEQDATRSIDLKPQAKSFNVRGLARLRSGRPEMAVGDFTMAAALDPHDKAFQANLATAMNVADDNANRIKYLIKIANHRPADGEIQLRLALAYEAAGDKQNATVSLQTAVEHSEGAVKNWAITELRSIGATKL